MQKARRRARNNNARSDRLWTHGFRFCFTPLPGVLPTFPSRYWFAIGLPQCSALRGGPRGFGRDSSCPDLLRTPAVHTRVRPVRGCHPLRRGFPAASGSTRRDSSREPTTPKRPKTQRFGLIPVRSPLLGESIFLSLIRVLRCFSSPAKPRHKTTVHGTIRAGCPIRVQPDQAPLAGPRPFSQLAAPFIACGSQGILHEP